MTSTAPQPPHPPASQQQQHQQPHPHHQHTPSQQFQPPQRANPQYNSPTTPVASSPLHSAVSPPNKRDLKSWWKGFKLPSKHQEVHDHRPQGIFGVPLRQSITYANVAISLVDEDGKSYIYGYVPIVVAKCGVFLKERATEIEGIFRLSGSEKRIKELKTVFDSPDRYGKGLVWDGYTVHDAANVLRRYLNDLPEPVVPLDLYEKFREPLRGATKQGTDAEGPQFVENFDMNAAIVRYQQLITELPPLNRQLLLYILDLLAVFAAKADQNRMNSQNLAAIFQPGMLSHPNHAMSPDEYRLNQTVIIFLIENQDHFLIGMQGTAADEQTVQEVQQGTPQPNAPATPSRKTGVVRTASNASAGAESVAKDGSIRRNKSTSSRRSMHSNGAPSPGSPALTATPAGGLARSNTVPSKKSPALPSGRFANRSDAPAPLTPVTASATVVSPPTVIEEMATPPVESTQPSAPAPAPVPAPSQAAPQSLPTLSIPPTAPQAGLPSLSAPAGRSQDRLLDPSPEVTTPSKERKLPILFQRMSSHDGEGRQPNKLRKKKMPGSAHPSAHSSTASLGGYSTTASPVGEVPNPLESIPSASRATATSETPTPMPADAASKPTEKTDKVVESAEPTPRAAQAPPTAQPNSLHPQTAEKGLKTKMSPPTSLHSSFNEGSDLDQFDEHNMSAPEANSPDTAAEKEKKKKLWRLSRKKDDAPPPPPPLASPRPVIGSNTHAEASSTSVTSSGYKPRKSLTGETSDLTEAPSHESGSREGREDSKSLTGWIKNKYREHKENVEHRRNKSPPGGERSVSLGSSLLSGRGKSLDLKRSGEDSMAVQASQVPLPPTPLPPVEGQPQPQLGLQQQDPNVRQ